MCESADSEEEKTSTPLHLNKVISYGREPLPSPASSPEKILKRQISLTETLIKDVIPVPESQELAEEEAAAISGKATKGSTAGVNETEV